MGLKLIVITANRKTTWIELRKSEGKLEFIRTNWNLDQAVTFSTLPTLMVGGDLQKKLVSLVTEINILIHLTQELEEVKEKIL